MGISKKLRFAIFKRDNFTCQYCGEKPPRVILEADHIVSKKDGGQDDEINLTTACFACNHGKGARSIDIGKVSQQSLKKEIHILKEEKEQLIAYYDFLKKRDAYEDDKLQVFQNAWEEATQGKNSLTEYGLKKIQRLLNTHSADDIFKAIKITWEKQWDKEDNGKQFSYMCGILRNLKLEKENPKLFEERKRAFQLRAKLKGIFSYISEPWFWKWIKDGVPPDDMESIADDVRNWSEFKQSIQKQFYS